jgi:hypothetical protein
MVFGRVLLVMRPALPPVSASSLPSNNFSERDLPRFVCCAVVLHALHL